MSAQEVVGYGEAQVSNFTQCRMYMVTVHNKAKTIFNDVRGTGSDLPTSELVLTFSPTDELSCIHGDRTH